MTWTSHRYRTYISYAKFAQNHSVTDLIHVAHRHRHFSRFISSSSSPSTTTTTAAPKDFRSKPDLHFKIKCPSSALVPYSARLTKTKLKFLYYTVVITNKKHYTRTFDVGVVVFFFLSKINIFWWLLLCLKLHAASRCCYCRAQSLTRGIYRCSNRCEEKAAEVHLFAVTHAVMSQSRWRPNLKQGMVVVIRN